MEEICTVFSGVQGWALHIGRRGRESAAGSGVSVQVGASGEADYTPVFDSRCFEQQLFESNDLQHCTVLLYTFAAKESLALATKAVRRCSSTVVAMCGCGQGAETPKWFWWEKKIVQHSLGDDTSSYMFGLDYAPVPTRAGFVELHMNIVAADGLFREHRCA